MGPNVPGANREYVDVDVDSAMLQMTLVVQDGSKGPRVLQPRDAPKDANPSKLSLMRHHLTLFYLLKERYW